VSTHDGRFAPSPTGSLHLGNLRTALLAWLFARARGARFLVRMEDLDRGRVRRHFEEEQLADLRALGLDWDGEVERQSERLEGYAAATAALEADGLLYPCWCTRAEIRAAASAPHGERPEGAYPGTCRELAAAERAARAASGRPPALRLRADDVEVSFADEVLGPQRGRVDDFVVRRNDGVPAYHLAVVVDDAAQGIGEVVRGADLLSSTARQLLLVRLLGLEAPRHAHVPLVLGPDGSRLAKRHGPVTLAERPEPPARVVGLLAETLGMAEAGEELTPAALLERFDAAALPREATVL
jgi:glutamyl-tRNA synthetase